MDGLPGQTPKEEAKTPPPPATPAQPTPAQPAPQAEDLATLRKQLADLQKERDTYAAAEEERKLQSLSEVEKLKAQLEKATTERKASEERYRESRKRSAAEIELAKRGCLDLGLAYSALPANALELADDGSVQGLAKALDALVASKPFLFTQQSSAPTGSGATTSVSSGAGVKTIKPADLARMSDTEFAQLERDVRAGRVRLS